jgi:uncharacterized protein YjiS (DUF1127 family)
VSALVAGKSSRPSFSQLAGDAIVGVVRLLILWRQLRSARRLLHAMPDELLSDMGVSRGAIDRAAAFGRETGEQA